MLNKFTNFVPDRLTTDLLIFFIPENSGGFISYFSINLLIVDLGFSALPTIFDTLYLDRINKSIFNYDNIEKDFLLQ